MSERYQRVFSGDENLYIENAPVVIRASALLKDTQTGKMIAQLKLQNMSGKKITYVKASVTQLDAVKKTIGSAVEFEYLDLEIADKEEFGSKKPLTLPSTSTRSFTVGITHVGFSDGTVWASELVDWKVAGADCAISKAVETEKIYREALDFHKNNTLHAQQQATKMFESIQKDKDVSIEIGWCDEKIAQLNRQAELLQEKADKRKNIIILISTIAVVVCVVMLILGYFIIYPWNAVSNGDYAVYINMYRVEEFEIPNGVTTIGDGAFADCTSLISVTIPDSITSIGERAFDGCSSLTNVTIPDSVTSIGSYAFSGCSSLTTIYCEANSKDFGCRGCDVWLGYCPATVYTGNQWEYVDGVPTAK